MERHPGDEHGREDSQKDSLKQVRVTSTYGLSLLGWSGDKQVDDRDRNDKRHEDDQSESENPG